MKISGQPIANIIAVDHRDRRRLGGEGDRRLSRRSRRQCRRWAGISSPSRWTSSAADTARASRRRRPITPNTPLPYRFALPTANHVFLPGHRIMVQIQSSWFPLYDRNPQTFVPNIFWAKPGDYQKGGAADLSRAGARELRRAADRFGAKPLTPEERADIRVFLCRRATWCHDFGNTSPSNAAIAASSSSSRRAKRRRRARSTRPSRSLPADQCMTFMYPQ